VALPIAIRCFPSRLAISLFFFVRPSDDISVERAVGRCCQWQRRRPSDVSRRNDCFGRVLQRTGLHRLRKAPRVVHTRLVMAVWRLSHPLRDALSLLRRGGIVSIFTCQIWNSWSRQRLFMEAHPLGKKEGMKLFWKTRSIAFKCESLAVFKRSVRLLRFYQVAPVHTGLLRFIPGCSSLHQIAPVLLPYIVCCEQVLDIRAVEQLKGIRQVLIATLVLRLCFKAIVCFRSFLCSFYLQFSRVVETACCCQQL